MNSKILVVVLLAYFLDNLSAGTVDSVKPSFLNVKNNPAYSKNALVLNQPIENRENENLQEFEENDDDDYEYEYVEEDDEEGGDEEQLVNGKTVESPIQNKPATTTKINNSSKKSQTNQPMISSSISKPIVQQSVKQENGNYQEFETFEDDDEEEIEYEEPLENIKTVTSGPMPSSSPSKPTVSKSVNQENDNLQEFETLEEDYDDEVEEKIGDGHKVEEYPEDPNFNTPTDQIMINDVQVNPLLSMNNPISNVPQLSKNELTDNDYDESGYFLNADEGHQEFKSYEWDQESSNNNNNPIDFFETFDRKNDYKNDQLINSNEFELNSYDNTQIPTEKQEENIEDQFKNQYVSENNERIINGYKALKNVLYMLHDYASSTFNWIINKLNNRIEQVSSYQVR